MKKFYKLLILFMTVTNIVGSKAQNTPNLYKWNTKQTTHISEEIVNELKDFKNLIPTATVDEIVAEHLFIDGNFRTAFKYLRSHEFSQLQKQLLNVPEIIDILEFLHLTTANATISHRGVTKIPTRDIVKASLNAYNDDAVAVAESDNGIEKITGIFKPNAMTIKNAKQALPRKPQQQFHIKEDINRYVALNDNDNAENTNSFEMSSNEEQTLVRIVLLEDLEVKAKVYNEGSRKHHHKYQHRQHSNSNHHNSSLGTFTSFVKEILQHLPHSAYQDMIKEKCSKNAKFAEFYRALRSSQFKPLIDQAKSTPNIMNVIQTLNSHDVDVNSLEPIAFEVISWGPDL